MRGKKEVSERLKKSSFLGEVDAQEKKKGN